MSDRRSSSAGRTYWLLRAGAWLVPWLPRRLAYALADMAAGIASLVGRRARHNLCANLQVVFATLPPQERTRLVRRTLRQCFRTAARNYVDLFQIPRRRLHELERVLEIEGWAYVDAALAEGRGLVVCMAHFGNTDWVGQYFVLHGYRATVPMEVPPSQRAWDLLVRLRGSQGMRLIPVEGSVRPLLRALRRNELVGIAADFLPQGATGVPVQFFGRTTWLPEGPAGLARLSGAPITAALAVRRPNHTFHAWIEPPFHVPRTPDEHADLIAGTQRLAEMLERRIVADPGQWVLFRRLWPACSAADAAGRSVSERGTREDRAGVSLRLRLPRRRD